MRIIGVLTLLLFAIFWCSGITMIQANEIALVLRFGNLVGSDTSEQVRPPGLLLAWPYPIDRVIRIPIKEERELTIDRLQLRDPQNPSSQLDPILDGYVLCGDQHILQTRVRVKYRIDDPVAFQFHSADPERLL